MSLQTMNQQTLPGRPLAVSLSGRPSKSTWARPSRFGYMVIIIFFGGLGGWAAVAPLASGVTVSGSIGVDSGIKTVQHLDGGMVTEILVREGDLVSKGQVMMRLDPAIPDAQESVQQARLIASLAQRARVFANTTNDDTMTLNDELMQAVVDPEHRKIVEGEMKLFEERRNGYERETIIRQERIARTRTELSMLAIQRETTQEALDLIKEELASVQELYDKRLTTKSRLLAIKRSKTGLSGRMGTIGGQMAVIGQRINEQELTIEAVAQKSLAADVERLHKLDMEISRRRISILNTQRVQYRTEVKSPSDGRVMSLMIKTVGAVVNRREVLMNIVPNNESMVLEGRVKAKDIEQVRKGAPVKIRLTAFNPRLTPQVDGEVVSVTPNTIRGTKGTRPMFGVTVTLDPVSLKRAIGDTPLTPGMPASGIIAVGERTLLSYLMTPMIASFEMALREP
jgi:HlyD family type I secretion membrane fusion protein